MKALPPIVRVCSPPHLLLWDFSIKSHSPLGHTPHQFNHFHLVLPPAHHLQSSQYISCFGPLTLCQIVFATMLYRLDFISGLPSWFLIGSPLTIAPRLCPGKPPSSLSLTLFPGLRLLVAERCSPDSCSDLSSG